MSNRDLRAARAAYLSGNKEESRNAHCKKKDINEPGHGSNNSSSSVLHMMLAEAHITTNYYTTLFSSVVWKVLEYSNNSYLLQTHFVIMIMYALTKATSRYERMKNEIFVYNRERARELWYAFY